MSEDVFVTLGSLGGGAAEERFQLEMAKILENLQDPNCDPEAVREITVKIKFHPNNTAQRAVTTIETSSKLAPYRAVESAVHFGIKNGEMVAVEHSIEQRALPGFPQVAADVQPMPPRLR